MPKDNNTIDAREKIKEIYIKVAGLLERMDDSERLADLAPVYNRVEMGIFRLVVMGEIKKGKSSFINALLGDVDLLPTTSDIATSTVFKILYGPEKKIKVFFYPDVDTGEREPPKTILENEISDYGTEAGNPGNEKRVDFIGIELCHPMLKNGLVIVDTPGVGGLYREHRDITLRYAPNADAVFFVLDSVESVISRDEILFLKELLKISSRRVVFIQTKIDAADEVSWKAWKERNQSIISDELDLPIENQLYFPVSAKLKTMADRRKSGKHLNRSGYLDLLHYLNHSLIPRKEYALAKDAASIFRACLADVTHLQKKTVGLLQQTSKDALIEMQKRLVEKKKSIAEWKSTTFQTEVQSFMNQLNDLKKSARNQMQNEMEPTGLLVSEMIDIIRNDDAIKAKNIAENIKPYQQDLLVKMSEAAANIQNQFNMGFQNLISQTLEHLGSSYELEVEVITKELDLNDTLIQKSLNMNFSKFESTRNVLYGGMAGGMIGNIALGVVALLFPPVAAMAGIAAIGGSCIGGSLASSNLQTRQKSEALQRLQQALQILAQKILRHSLSQQEEMTVKLEREANLAFGKSAKRMQSELEKEIQDVQEAAKATKEESAEKLKQTSLMLNETTQLISDIEGLLKLEEQ